MATKKRKRKPEVRPVRSNSERDIAKILADPETSEQFVVDHVALETARMRKSRGLPLTPKQLEQYAIHGMGERRAESGVS